MSNSYGLSSCNNCFRTPLAIGIWNADPKLKQDCAKYFVGLFIKINYARGSSRSERCHLTSDEIHRKPIFIMLLGFGLLI